MKKAADDDVRDAITAGVSMPDMKPLEDWADAVEKFEAKPSARNRARLDMQSHNLSSRLEDAGIEISPDRLTASVGDSDSGDPLDAYIQARYGNQE